MTSQSSQTGSDTGSRGADAPGAWSASSRQRSLMLRIAALFDDRARREAAIQKDLKSGTSAADKKLKEQMAELDDRRARDQQKAESKFQEEMLGVSSTFERESSAGRKSFEEAKQAVILKTTNEERSALKALKDALWTVETVFEGNERKPGAEFELTRKEIEKKLQDHVAVESQAAVVLTEYRQPIQPGEEGEPPEGFTEPTGSAADRYAALAADGKSRLAALSSKALPRFFSQMAVPVILVLLISGGAAALAAWQRGWKIDSLVGGAAGASLIITSMIMWMLARTAKRQVRDARGPLIWMLMSARQASEAWLASAAEKRDQAAAALVKKRDEESAAAKAKFEPLALAAKQERTERVAQLQQDYLESRGKLDARREAQAAAVSDAHREALDTITRHWESGVAAVKSDHETSTRSAREAHERAWTSLESDWNRGIAEFRREVDAIADEDARMFPAWASETWRSWRPSADPARDIRLGEMRVDLAKLPGGLSAAPKLSTHGPSELAIPASLALPDHASVFLKFGAKGRDAAIRVLRTMMLRLLLTLPPGKARFTIIDPVGLGESFAGFMHLADYEEALVTGKIWTEARHIEQRLVDLTEHMENVIQKYLRNEFRTIAEYNAQAGEIAEPYRFLVIADFPANFNEQAAARLASICSSGARCGVHTLIAMDTRQQLPGLTQLSDLEKNSLRLTWKEDASGARFVWDDKDLGQWPLTVDQPPEEETFNELVHMIGDAARDSNRVQVPFDLIAPSDEDLWSGDTTNDLRVPLGRCGATKLQYLTLGRGTAQHVLIAGKTGSGKSTILHALITNLAMWFSPDEVNFYLVDFKKGVEFKSYAAYELPHARAVAIESDREFGLSVLTRLDAELKRRGNLFRDLSAQDLAGFRKKAAEAGPPYSNEKLPRTLLIIDEFQEFFTEDDKLAADATLLLDRLVRQGRAFGIHVVLGSQTLSGAYNLARSTMGQMGVRIALQCSEADSYLILSEDNAAARLLSRPGEAIYNDASGLVEGNSPFQVAWLSDDQRDAYLDRVMEKTRATGYRMPEPQSVFEGNVPSDVSRNRVLASIVERSAPPTAAGVTKVWLGDAIAIKDPTAATLRRQTASNLLIVGQRDESVLAMMAAGMVSIAAQQRDRSKAYVLDSTPADSSHAGYLERVCAPLPGSFTMVGVRDIPQVMTDLAAELTRRQESGASDDPPVFLVINGIHRYRSLRKAEDDFGFSMSDDKEEGPEKKLANLLREGPAVGMHAIVWCDTAGNVSRALDRQGTKEFDWRVLFQMSSTDSSTLIDSPEAGKLGLHRAILYSEEQGTVEKFRPYALPDERWTADAANRLRGAQR